MAENYIRGEWNASLDVKRYESRLKLFYNHWDHFNGTTKAFLVKLYRGDEFEMTNLFHCWLFGREFFDTSLLFMKDSVYCFCSNNLKLVLNILIRSTLNSIGAKLVFVPENQNTIEFKKTVVSSKIGYIGEGGDELLQELFKEEIQLQSVEISNVTTSCFYRVFDVKDEIEIQNMDYGAKLSCHCIRKLVLPKLRKIITDKQIITHYELVSDCILKKDELNFDVRNEYIKICSPLVIQSGKEIDITPSASNNDQEICYEDGNVIIFSCGYSYKQYGSYVARTLLVNGTEFQKRAYKALLKARKAVFLALEVSEFSRKEMRKVYKAARDAVEEAEPDLCPYITGSVGVGIGLLFREFGLVLDDTNSTQIKKGMVFDVSIGFKDLKEGDQKFSMLLGDTVVAEVPYRNLTNFSGPEKNYVLDISTSS